MSNITYINNRAIIKNKLPMKSRVKNEAYVLYIDGHYVPFGENIFEDNGKQIKNYIHYGHYKELDTARLIAEMHLVSTGRLSIDKARNIKVTEEFSNVIKKNSDIKKLLNRYQEEYNTQLLIKMLEWSVSEVGNMESEEVKEELKEYISFSDNFRDDLDYDDSIPF